MTGRIAAAAVLLAVLSPPTAAAQTGPRHPSDSGGDLGYLAANALVGGLSAGFVAWLRGEDFTDALGWGTLGGAASYAGKWIVAEDFDGAGFLGRQVAAVGHSVIESAGRGDGPLEELWLPLGPVRVRAPFGGASWDVQLDVTDAAVVLYALASSDLDFDAGLSLRQGTPVFISRGHDLFDEGYDADGVALSGAVFLSGDLGPRTGLRFRSALVHETVHVLQHDFADVAWSYPFEMWVRRELLPEWGHDDSVQLGVFVGAIYWISDEWWGEDAPLSRLIEREAHFLDGR